jgi:alkylated DNA repair dioxygenase AlkB
MSPFHLPCNMAQPLQGDLFDELNGSDQPRIDMDAFDRAVEHRLDDRSWITHVPGFVIGHGQLLAALSTLAGWEQRRRWMYNRVVDEPRLTAEYVDLATAPATVVELAATLSKRLGVPYDRVWMNWYRDHTDGTGWHADRPANKAPTAVVPVLSLGAPRRFLVRPAGAGSSTVFTPAGGDLIIMAGRCQRDWQHCVPKQKTAAGARMSLNFSSITQSQ